MNQEGSFDEASPYGDLAVPLPAHLRAPEGLSQNVHDINLAITALLLEVEAGYRWLNRSAPDADAAKVAFSRVLVHAQRIDFLVRDLMAIRAPDK